MLWRLGSKDRTYNEVIRDLIERAAIKEPEVGWNRIQRTGSSSRSMTYGSLARAIRLRAEEPARPAHQSHTVDSPAI